LTAILKFFIELCLLRKGPQDAPPSPVLLISTGTLLILTAILSDQLHGDLLGKLSFALAQVALLSAVVWVILSIRKVSERTIQTLTALYGSGTLIQLLIWPFRAQIVGMEDPQQAQVAMLPLMAIVGFAIWSFIIMIHIYRNALDITRGKAIMISILTQIIVGMAMFSMFQDLRP
jgi:hypothetical protein